MELTIFKKTTGLILVLDLAALAVEEGAEEEAVGALLAGDHREEPLVLELYL